MSVIRLPIDIKSLYFNIKNDNEKGHTATVATPLKQGASVHEELSKIHCIPHNINDYSRDSLVGHILSLMCLSLTVLQLTESLLSAIAHSVYTFEKKQTLKTYIAAGKKFTIRYR